MQPLILKTAYKHILGSNHSIKMYAVVLILSVGIGDSLYGPSFQTEDFHIGIDGLNGLNHLLVCREKFHDLQGGKNLIIHLVLSHL